MEIPDTMNSPHVIIKNGGGVSGIRTFFENDGKRILLGLGYMILWVIIVFYPEYIGQACMLICICFPTYAFKDSVKAETENLKLKQEPVNVQGIEKVASIQDSGKRNRGGSLLVILSVGLLALGICSLVLAFS